MKQITIFSLILIAITVITLCFGGVIGREEASGDVSSGLYVIAGQNGMAKYALSGNDMLFSAEDFERALNVSSIESITVTETPSITEGSLCLGNTLLSAGHTVSRANLDLLNYKSASEDISTGSFKFKVDGFEYEMTCNLYFLNRENSAPTTAMESERTLSVSTHQGTMMYGKVGAYDQDGDDIRIEVTSYPKNGILDMNVTSGEYTYIPLGSYFGEDSFTYVAVDKYGNYSGAQEVSLTVQKREKDVFYADMDSHPQHHAALTMTEKNIMSGTVIGDSLYFMPDKTVSRIDFLVMTMNAIGITDVKSVDNTGFDDDSEIPTLMKGYVTKARELGMISGSVKADGSICFEPNRAITRAEAALIINSIIDGRVPVIKPVFADAGDIPTWASDAIYSLTYLGIMSAENGNISASSEITRGQTAQMLYELLYVIK